MKESTRNCQALDRSKVRAFRANFPTEKRLDELGRIYDQEIERWREIGEFSSLFICFITVCAQK